MADMPHHQVQRPLALASQLKIRVRHQRRQRLDGRRPVGSRALPSRAADRLVGVLDAFNQTLDVGSLQSTYGYRCGRLSSRLASSSPTTFCFTPSQTSLRPSR